MGAGLRPAPTLPGYDILRMTDPRPESGTGSDEASRCSINSASRRVEGANMGKLGGSGLLIAGIVLLLLGLILRWDLIDWLIDLTGLILIVLGVILVVWGAIQMFTGGGRGSSMDY